MAKMKRTQRGWTIEQELERGGCKHERTREVSHATDGHPAMAIVCCDCGEQLAVATLTMDVER